MTAAAAAAANDDDGDDDDDDDVFQGETCHSIFLCNCCISWSIFIIFVPLETQMNTIQLFTIYLLNDVDYK